MFNYVKFQRGTKKAYDNLVKYNKIDDDTLYFIYNDKKDKIGELYLGNKLITGNMDISISTRDLQDVMLNSPVEDDLLIFQGDKWINKSPEEIAYLLLNKLNLSDDFIITNEKTLTLKGYLLTENEKEILSKIQLSDSGSIKIDEITVSQIKDFEDYQVIKEVNSEHFDLDNINKRLNLSSKVLDKFNNSQVGNLSQLLDRVSPTSTIVDEINSIKEILKWEEVEK